MTNVPKLSEKEASILTMLCQEARELYGLEMVETSSGLLKRGTIYVTLGRMEEKGYISSRQEEVHPGMRGIPRRLYRPTGLGQRVLAAWEAAAERFAAEGI
jgi:PadR family transcriptional regulator, regulatory protein PadR